MNKKKSFEVSINNLPAALKRLDLPAEQVKVIEDYKKQFPFLIEDEENVLISLDQLWEALDTPYYTAPGKPPELSGGLEKPRTAPKEKEYKRKKFTQWRDDVAAKDKVRFNSLVKKIAGARNIKETDLDEYYHVQFIVFDGMKRGRTDSEILAFHLGDEAA